MGVCHEVMRMTPSQCPSQRFYSHYPWTENNIIIKSENVTKKKIFFFEEEKNYPSISSPS